MIRLCKTDVFIILPGMGPPFINCFGDDVLMFTYHNLYPLTSHLTRKFVENLIEQANKINGYIRLTWLWAGRRTVCRGLTVFA